MLLYGSQRHTLDDKNRVKVPTKFLDVFGKAELTLTMGLDHTLYLMTKEEFEKMNAPIQKLNPFDKKRHSVVARSSYFTQDVLPDGQGRITLSDNLKDYLQLEGSGQIMFVGQYSYVELWANDRFERSVLMSDENIDKMFDELRQMLDGETD